jgi:hypothetical protein
MSMPATDLARKTAELANGDVGVREVGNNDGPRVRQYQILVGLKPPAPYCAAAVSYWINAASRELNQPCQFRFSGGALRLLSLNTALAFEPETLTPDALPCVGVIDHHDAGKGHAFLIVGMADDGTLQTIEANSNGAGSREGQGVYVLNLRHANQLSGCIRIA